MIQSDLSVFSKWGGKADTPQGRKEYETVVLPFMKELYRELQKIFQNPISAYELAPLRLKATTQPLGRGASTLNFNDSLWFKILCPKYAKSDKGDIINVFNITLGTNGLSFKVDSVNSQIGHEFQRISLDYSKNLKDIANDIIGLCNKYFEDYIKNGANLGINSCIKEMKTIMIKKSLISCNNIIFTGAPGTGKTYLAKEIAKAMTGDNEAHYEMVQFHPSYDYSDFVEGLRPVKNANGNIGFERKDGVFKAFCKNALVDGYTMTEEGWKYKGEKAPKYVFIIDEINRGEMSKIFGELFFSIDPGYRGTDGRIKTQYANLTEHPNEFDKALGIVEQKDDNGMVINAENFGHFFVPENVYIIGTMNDIDRSVESMDFAMRRRFTFKEITATSRIDMWDGNIDDTWKNVALSKMNAINSVIEQIPGLNAAYHIGPSYFMKIQDMNGNWNELWNSNLKGLVAEYLRGMPDANDRLQDVEDAYNKA